jgi:RNA polymerase sigma-70 factor, ECF subfamily
MDRPDHLEAPACCCSEWMGGLAREHASRLVAVARREGLHGDDALDAVQEGFRILLTRPDREALREREGDAARVLVAIGRTAARTRRRRKHRAAPHRPIDDGDVVDRAPAADQALADAATAEQLAGCVAGLPEVHRHVVALRVLEEVSGDEAARALGLTPGHVAVLLHRARKQLERCMGDADAR